MAFERKRIKEEDNLEKRTREKGRKKLAESQDFFGLLKAVIMRYSSGHSSLTISWYMDFPQLILFHSTQFSTHFFWV